MQNNKIKGATALYCRTARADEPALESQKNTLRRCAEKHGFDAPVFYLDNGQSGIAFDRPSFGRMNNDIREGKIQTVIALNTARIGRNAADVMRWLDVLHMHGVKFIAADCPLGSSLIRRCLQECGIRRIAKKSTNRVERTKPAGLASSASSPSGAKAIEGKDKQTILC
jgi:hypothetical protein